MGHIPAEQVPRGFKSAHDFVVRGESPIPPEKLNPDGTFKREEKPKPLELTFSTGHSNSTLHARPNPCTFVDLGEDHLSETFLNDDGTLKIVDESDETSTVETSQQE